MGIKNSYLMWVGSEHYAGIEDWTKEAVSMGVSKRLPGAAVGSKLLEDDTVIFVAHDEGESTDCAACMGDIECPECRKREVEQKRLGAEVLRITGRFESEEDFETFASASQKRSVRVRREKVEKLVEKSNECEVCDGEGHLKTGTGGEVVLKGGDVMDYRQYNYWLHQPKKFDADQVKVKKMCDACGGTGKIPCSKIFGMFVPDRIEYIVNGDEDKAALEKVAGFEKVAKGVAAAEPKRGCGKRKPGGVYAVTDPKGKGKAVKNKIKELVEKGIITPEATELHGNFVRFLEPVEVKVKRFRGVKSWALDPDVEDQADDVLDAIAS